MGTGVSRIEQEFILTTVQDKHIPVQIHGDRREAEGRIVSFSERDVEIEHNGTLAPSMDEKLRVFFSYYGHVMTFASSVRRATSDRIILAYPKGIYKHLQRKYERVAPPVDIQVSFQLENTKVELNFPKTEEYNPAERPELSEQFNPDSLLELMRTFRESLADRCTANTITMFRGREPSTTEETLIAATARILYIPQTGGDFPEFEDSLNEQVITRDMLMRPSGEGRTEGQESSSGTFTQEGLARFLNAKRDQGIVSELYCPIIFHEYVVGYIHLASTDPDKVFDEELVKYVSQFSRMLAYSLKINHYFKDMDLGPEEFNAKIVDLSASGLLFAHNSRKLKDTLMIYADINLMLQVGDRRIKIVARVMRKFEDRSACFYGVQFLDMPPEDFRFLFDLVYGRPFTKEDNELWEGGAPPPPLEL